MEGVHIMIGPHGFKKTLVAEHGETFNFQNEYCPSRSFFPISVSVFKRLVSESNTIQNDWRVHGATVMSGPLVFCFPVLSSARTINVSALICLD